MPIATPKGANSCAQYNHAISMAILRDEAFCSCRMKVGQVICERLVLLFVGNRDILLQVSEFKICRCVVFGVILFATTWKVPISV